MKTVAVICFLVLMNPGLSQSLQPFSILIHEIMADPTPVVDLPNAEFIELKNSSKITIDLFRWKITVGNTTVSINQSYALQPDSLVLICAKSQQPLFNLPQKTIGLTSFPSLPNEEGTIALIAPDGRTIHGIEYKSSMHENTLKANGGWSLEMINNQRPCSPQNYYSSQDPKGGTPGMTNSVNSLKPFPDSVYVKQCFAMNPNTLLLELNQGIDSLAMSNSALFKMDSSAIKIIRAEPIPPLFSSIQLSINTSFRENKIYTLTVEKLISCFTKSASPGEQISTGLPKHPEPKDIILNEILYDPPKDGADFIELLNTSSAILNLKSIYAANRINPSSYTAPIMLSEKNQNILPGEMIVLSTDTAFIKRQWPNSINKQLVSVKQLPSLPNTSGTLVLLNHQGKVIEEFQYHDDMHFSLLRNTEGVSLERIHTSESAMAPNNWHSAAASVNYATPTQQNSQKQQKFLSNKKLELSSNWISPDNDGLNDVLNLQYQFGETGYMLSASLFNLQGNLVAKIFNNELCTSEGSFVWKGLDHLGNKIQPGVYILFTEAIHKIQKPVQWKKTIAIK